MSQRLDQLTKLHQADPTDAFCTYGIGLEYAKAGQANQAVQWMDKTLAIDPHYCYAYYHKAKILSENAKVDQAREVLRTGIAVAEKLGTRDSTHAAKEMATLLNVLG